MQKRSAYTRISQFLGGVLLLVCALAVGQQTLRRPESAEAVQPIFSSPIEWRPLSAELPQGRLYCGGAGRIAYRDLLPERMRQIASQEVMITARAATSEVCAYRLKSLDCKDAQARLLDLQRSLRECR